MAPCRADLAANQLLVAIRTLGSDMLAHGCWCCQQPSLTRDMACSLTLACRRLEPLAMPWASMWGTTTATSLLREPHTRPSFCKPAPVSLLSSLWCTPCCCAVAAAAVAPGCWPDHMVQLTRAPQCTRLLSVPWHGSRVGNAVCSAAAASSAAACQECAVLDPGQQAALVRTWGVAKSRISQLKERRILALHKALVSLICQLIGLSGMHRCCLCAALERTVVSGTQDSAHNRGSRHQR